MSEAADEAAAPPRPILETPAPAAGLAPGSRIFLVRHGETPWNAERRIQGQIDVDLSLEGRRQAEQVGLCLRCEGIDAVISSDLARARSTAELAVATMGRETPIFVEPRIRELVLGEFEGRYVADLQRDYPVEWAAWRRDALRNRPPGGEELPALLARCRAAIEEWAPAYSGRTILLVAHGGPLRALTLALLGLPLEFYPRLRVDNCGITRIVYGAGGAVLASYNETGHLAPVAPAEPHASFQEQ